MNTPRQNAHMRFRLMSAAAPMLIELPAVGDEPPKFLLSALIKQADGTQYHFPLGELYATPFEDEDTDDENHAAPGSLD